VVRGWLSAVDASRFLTCLADDYTRLRTAVAGALDERVPSCPDWTGADLAYHVAEVYLHKTETMRQGRWPAPWPPDLSGEQPLAALDRAYAELTAELTTRDPEAPALTWFPTDQTVGFWHRRMAQETVIHRVDAELAAGLAHDPIPDDLAEDGIDEVLTRFLAFESVESAEEIGDQVAACDGATVRMDTGAASWLVALGPDAVIVERGHADTDAVIRADPAATLRWLWRRAGDEAVTVEGNHTVVDRLRALLGATTQ
jgi:uncharacterized protein (TIGR03083 family)